MSIIGGRNFSQVAGDYLDMRCDEIRLALSARIDGEDPGLAETELTSHLHECAGCSAWLTGAERVTRAVRLQSLQIPDLTAVIMAAVAADQAGRAPLDLTPRQRGREQVLRLAVAAVAIAQLLLVLPTLLNTLGLAVPAHTRHELATFDAALAVGFLFAAWRPALARAYLPVACVLAAGLAITAGIDIAHGVTTVSQETGHLFAAVQAALLWALSRFEPRARRSAARSRAVA